MIQERDWDLIERLQDGIPLASRPFAQVGQDLGMEEAEVLERVGRLLADGCLRRLGPRLRHQQAGVRGNIMVVWRVPPEQVESVGETLAASPHVTHCYQRPAFEGFPYNLYSMVHASDVTTAEAVVASLAQACGICDYRMLHTLRELKKSTPLYRRPEEST